MEGSEYMDAVDRQLIQALRENGRASYAELGRLVGLSGPSVTDRINRLEQAGFIAGDDSFMLKVRVPDVDGLEHTIRRLSGIKGVARTRTTVVLSTKWENRVGALP